MAITPDISPLGSNLVDGAATTIACTTNGTVRAGAHVIVALGWFAVDQPVSVDDNGPRLSWNVTINGAQGSANVAIAWAYAPIGMASGTTITATYGTTCNGRAIIAASFSGISTIGLPVDTTSGPTISAAGAWTTASMTLQPGSMIVATNYSFSNLGNTPTAPSIEIAEQVHGVNQDALVAEYRIGSLPGAYTVAGTWADPQAGATVAVAFKAEQGARQQVGVLHPVSLGGGRIMAILATDNFTRADEDPISQGGNWTNPASDRWKILSNEAVPTVAGNDCYSTYTGVSFPNDQYAAVAVNGIGTFSSEAGLGVVLRFTDANNLYRVVTNSVEVSIAKIQSSVFSVITTRAVTFTNGQILKVEVRGTTLRVYQNGVQLGADISDATTTLLSGRAGLYNSGPTSAPPTGLTSFEAGSIDTAGRPSFRHAPGTGLW